MEFLDFTDENESELSVNDPFSKFWFDKDFQDRLCAVLIRNESIYVKLHEIVKFDYFIDNFNREVYKITKKYFAKFKTLPAKEIIFNELLSVSKDKEKSSLYKLKLNSLFEIVLDANEDYIQSNVRTFCKKVEALKLLIIFQKKIDAAFDESDMDSAFDFFKTNLRQGLGSHNLGIQIFNSENNYRTMYSDSSINFRVPTGLPTFDSKTLGGIGNGEVGTILGAPKMGKSQILVNFCKHGALSSEPQIVKGNEIKYNPVLYITQELSEEDVHTRFLSSFSNLEMSLFTKYRIDPRYLDRREVEKVEKVLDDVKDINKYVRIKYFKPKELTPEKLSDYIYEVEYSDKVKVRAVYHDYLKKLSYSGHAKDDYLGLGYITTQLIGIAKDFKLPIWSPMQLNRTTSFGGKNDSTKVANSFQIIEDLDHVLVMNPSLEDKFLMDLSVDRSRRSDDSYDIKVRLNKANCFLEEIDSSGSQFINNYTPSPSIETKPIEVNTVKDIPINKGNDFEKSVSNISFDESVDRFIESNLNDGNPF